VLDVYARLGAKNISRSTTTPSHYLLNIPSSTLLFPLSSLPTSHLFVCLFYVFSNYFNVQMASKVILLFVLFSSVYGQVIDKRVYIHSRSDHFHERLVSIFTPIMLGCSLLCSFYVIGRVCCWWSKNKSKSELPITLRLPLCNAMTGKSE